MATPIRRAFLVARNELRTRTALMLELIALRHQIAVLERNRTCRPCFRRSDRLLGILLSRWWPKWRESLMIVQAETVLRWCRNGWSAIWGYRSRGRWRGGRVVTKNSESSEKSRVLRFTVVMSPACSRSCVRSFLCLPADSVAGRF